MSDRFITGFGVEGVQFTDHPVPTPFTVGRIEFGGPFGNGKSSEPLTFKETMATVLGITESDLKTETIEQRPLTDFQLKQIAEHFGLVSAKEQVDAHIEQEIRKATDEIEAQRHMAEAWSIRPSEGPVEFADESELAQQIVRDAVDNNQAPDFSNLFLPIRVGHGYVKKGDRIWWRHRRGPRQVISDSGDTWENIRLFPELYQWVEPGWNGVGYLD